MGEKTQNQATTTGAYVPSIDQVTLKNSSSCTIGLYKTIELIL